MGSGKSDVRMDRLKEAVAEHLRASNRQVDLPEVCDRLGMGPLPDDADWDSKRTYVLARLDATPDTAVPGIAVSVGDASADLGLSEAGLALVEEDAPKPTEITRKAIADILEREGLSGDLNALDFLGRIWPLEKMDVEFMGGCLADEVHRHMVVNEGDWTVPYLFGRLGAYKCSLRRFLGMVELALDPICRRGADQDRLRDMLAEPLARDGYRIERSGSVSGYPTYVVRPMSRGVAGRPKNLIFASTGPKPDIGFADAVSNDVVILSNADSCLVYDRPISESGLLWSDLADWWAARHPAGTDGETVRRDLGQRLRASLGSDGERNLFDTYFRAFRHELGDRLPAIIPQVYLHYDPATLAMLKGRKRLPRQRMDFLFLLPGNARVVVEVDGRQHFAEENGIGSLAKYAEMVAEDRRLKLAGYEVYRFGSNELVGEGMERIVKVFFAALLSRHGVC